MKTRAQPVSFPAPVRGLTEHLPITQPDRLSAEFCENFLPTTRGLRVRGGKSRAAYIAEPVVSLFPFVEPVPEFFAASATAVYDVTPLNPTTAPAASLQGLSSGDWSHQQVGISGGNRLLIANGADLMQIYDGATWVPLTDEAINALGYDAPVTAFAIGETVTGGTSGATATIHGVTPTTLYLGAITGAFVDDEALTSASGAATANGTAAAASAVTVTGVDTDKISHVWLYKARVFMVEKDTLRAWYLPVGQVGGAALDLNLGGIFRRGGSLVFGATWSLDAGDGQDDQCVFVSSEGEVAIYTGTNPGDPAAWQLAGRYDIPRPVGKNAAINAGGDLAIATVDGIVPLSAAINKDPAALGLSAVSRGIERTWATVSGQSGIELHKWADADLLLVVLPASDFMPTANLETGAWGRQTGWAGTCGGEFAGGFFVGAADGRVYKVNDTGADDGAPFIARACFAFTDLGDPTTYKHCSLMRLAHFGRDQFNAVLGVAVDYFVDFPTPASAVGDPIGTMVWGSSTWGGAIWGGRSSDPGFASVGKYRSVIGQGSAVAPTVQITSGGSLRLDTEVLSVDLLLEAGGRVT